MHGQVRVPDFQRPLRWEAPQVVALFDSIYKGYPIGSLLLQKRKAPATEVKIGPLRIEAPELPEALWVVDGQQRLTSLAAGLARPAPIPVTPDDPFVVYFDAAQQKFETPPRTGLLPTTWVPVAQLLNAAGLMEWVLSWQHLGDVELRATIFEASRRLREYQVPLYTVETSDEEVLRNIFYRVNAFGKEMQWSDVHKALFGTKEEYPSTLPELAKVLADELGMGYPSEQTLLTYVMASRGLDPTRNLTEHSRRGEGELEKMRHAVHDALPVLTRALNFLRNEAEIPHLQFLPRSLPLAVLTRYFSLFPNPSSRSLQLLVRWTWRVLLGSQLLDERTLLRHGVLNLNPGSDEKQAQALLRLVPHTLPKQLEFKPPARFDARAAESRLVLLGLYSLEPRLPDLQPVILSALLNARNETGLRLLFPSANSKSSAANRLLLPGATLTNEQQKLLEQQPDAPVQLGPATEQLRQLDYEANAVFFQSQAIEYRTFEALKQRGRGEEFLRLRNETIQRLVRTMGDRLAAWGQSDRVSIDLIAAETQQAE